MPHATDSKSTKPVLPNTPTQALRELEYWQAALHLAELKFEVARRLLEQAQANLDLVKSVARGDFEEDVPAEPNGYVMSVHREHAVRMSRPWGWTA
jgi:hypothetical protein